MSQKPTDPPGPEQKLSEIVLAYLEAVQEGKILDRQQFLESHPEFAADLADFFANRDHLDRLVAPLRATAPVEHMPVDSPGHSGPTLLDPQAPQASEMKPPRRSWLGQIGDFRLFREIGRGGMGIVYEAEQVSLSRRVALKVLPFAAAFDQRQLQRFKNEAQAAAQLHHTNIVPVFAVGSERGVHYYAMQFIEGQSLATVIAELQQAEPQQGNGVHEPKKALPDKPAPATVAEVRTEKETGRQPNLPGSSGRSGKSQEFFRRFAQLGLTAAEALEHAHQMGVVHRDIKPANLLVDGRGNLWITDFGLAQFQSNLGLTLSGEVLGTLRYMSPEQALAKRVLVDHRTDIYSLGVTLYELATLHPVFAGQDRHELLRQIAFEEPRPPRALDRCIPEDLETIILKAIAKEPAERYATAQELADDLQRFLSDKPVLARRPSLLVQAVKWSRRHRPVVVSALVLLVVGFLGLAVSMAIIWREHAATTAAYEREREAYEREREAHERERQKAQEASRERALAQQSFMQARRNLEFFTLLSEEDLAHKPGLQRLRKKLLETALAYHRSFIQQHSTQVGGDLALQTEVASSHSRIARILNAQGSTIEALIELERARDLLEKLARDKPKAREFPNRLAAVNFDILALQGCDRLFLLTQKEIQSDLKLNQGQSDQIARLEDRLAVQRREVVQDHQELPLVDQREEFKSMVAANERAFAEILTSEQTRRLDQILLQLQGPLAFNNPEVMEALQLTSKQKAKIEDIQDQAFSSPFPHRNCFTTMAHQEAEGLQATARERILQQLTAEQRARWRELTGAPYRGPLIAPLLRPSVALRMGMR
jgi:serine/threonine protein kinase